MQMISVETDDLFKARQPRMGVEHLETVLETARVCRMTVVEQRHFDAFDHSISPPIQVMIFDINISLIDSVFDQKVTNFILGRGWWCDRRRDSAKKVTTPGKINSTNRKEENNQ